MKKLLSLALILTLVLTLLVGCGASAQNSQGTDSNTLSQQQETASAPTAQTEPVSQAETKAQNTQSEQISEDKAKKIALDHAGLSENDVTALFVELDYDDGVLRYEVDFRQGMTEYDYDIEASTGKILSYDKDIDD